MKKAIIIHGWELTPKDEWVPWLGSELHKARWEVEMPQMPHTKTPKLNEWLAKLKSLRTNKDTVLIGHSLANALILKYLEDSNNLAMGAVMVAAWDWLLEGVKEYHQTFFENGFDYNAIKNRNLPLFIINSMTDPWIDYKKSMALKSKINAKFIGIENAGHFMEKDGYKKFPELLKLIIGKY